MTNRDDTQKPIIVFVDDEPRNLAVFEASMPDEWEVKLFDNAVQALEEVKKITPWVIVSDQRMPQMSGLQFLQIASLMLPATQRIIVTGQTEEDVIIRLFCEAKIHDYIRKPWEADKLLAQIRKAMDFYKIVAQRENMVLQLEQKAQEMERMNIDLKKATVELKESKIREHELRVAIEGWAPWAISEALETGSLSFPKRCSIACIVFDIVNSHLLAEVMIDGKAARARIISLFREIVIRNGGMTESQAGDAGFAHFGAFVKYADPVQSAYAAASEFRMKLRDFAAQYKLEVECGVALHFAKDVLIDQAVAKAFMPNGKLREEKSIESQSSQIDLVHRIEKLVHVLPGSNIVLTEEFHARLTQKSSRTMFIGTVQPKGHEAPTQIFLVPSDKLGNMGMEEIMKVLLASPAGISILLKRQSDPSAA